MIAPRGDHGHARACAATALTQRGEVAVGVPVDGRDRVGGKASRKARLVNTAIAPFRMPGVGLERAGQRLKGRQVSSRGHSSQATTVAHIGGPGTDLRQREGLGKAIRKVARSPLEVDAEGAVTGGGVAASQDGASAHVGGYVQWVVVGASRLSPDLTWAHQGVDPVVADFLAIDCFVFIRITRCNCLTHSVTQ